MTQRSKNYALIALASAGASVSLALALAGAPVWVIWISFAAAGAAAAAVALTTSPMAPHDVENPRLVEDVAVKRQRSIDVGNAVVSLRGQVVYGLLGLTLLFVGTPAVMFCIGGMRVVALPLGVLFLVLLWLHWRAAWALHRSVPGVVGVSVNWPEGSLSPADRRFIHSLVVAGGLWFLLLLTLSAGARNFSEMGALAGIGLLLGLPLLLHVRKLWNRTP